MTPATVKFQEGDRVRVRWMGETVDATVVHLERRHGRPHHNPVYWLVIPGVKNRVGYRQDEMEAA